MQEATRSFAIIAVLAGSVLASTSKPGSVPQAATREAERILAEHLAGPAAFISQGDTVPNPVIHSEAELGPPWKLYRLSGEDCLRYKQSSNSDPVAFAFSVLYNFPVYSQKLTIAVISVVRNRNRDGSKILPTEGEFVPPGFGMLPYTGRRRWLLDAVQELREQYPGDGGHAVFAVEFRAQAGPRYFVLVATDDGQTLIKHVGPESDNVPPVLKELLSLSKAAPSIKAGLEWTDPEPN